MMRFHQVRHEEAEVNPDVYCPGRRGGVTHAWRDVPERFTSVQSHPWV